MGDIIHSLPVLYSLYHSINEVEIHWVVARGFEGLLQSNPMIKKLIIIDKDVWKRLNMLNKTVGELINLSKDLKDESYDIVLDLQGLFRSGVLTAMTRAPIRIGFSDAREGSHFFYNQKIKGGKDIHAVYRYLKIAEALIGHKVNEIHFPLGAIEPSLKIRLLVDKLKRYNIIVPGARWQSKRWHAEGFARLTSLLDDRSVVIGSNADLHPAQVIRESAKDKVIDMTSKTDIKDMIYLIKNARLVVTNDTGPMHIASALNVPLVAIFGSTNPVRTGPLGKNHRVLKAEIDCSPCYKKSCSKMTCMDIISVEQVLSCVEELLSIA